MAAITEHVLHIVQRHVPVAVWQTVLEHGCTDALTVKPFRGVLSLVHVSCEPIGSAWADDDHLAVRILCQIKFEPRAVTGEFQIHILGQFLRLSAAVGLSRAECYALDSLINILSFRVQIDNLVRLACELLSGDFRQLLLAVHAFKLLAEPSFQSR